MLLTQVLQLLIVKADNNGGLGKGRFHGGDRGNPIVHYITLHMAYHLRAYPFDSDES